MQSNSCKRKNGEKERIETATKRIENLVTRALL